MRNPAVIAVVNEKGGTGKTSTAVNLAAALGELKQRVLLVDLDGQAASSRWLGVEDDNRLAEAMCRGKGLEPIPEVLPGVSLAPASGKLDSVAHDLRPTQGGQLRKVLSEMKDFDFILIDCPPSLGNRLIGNALLAATHVMVPVETSILALDGLKILLETLEDVRGGFDHQLILSGVLACRYDPRTRLSRLVLEELRRALPGKVFRTVIRENVRMRECPASGQSILTFAPDCHAAEDYRALAGEMLESPERWMVPAPGMAPAAGSDAAQAKELSVEGLRDNAAARVREAAGWMNWRKPPVEVEPKPQQEPKSGAADAGTPPPGPPQTAVPAEAKQAEAQESAPAASKPAGDKQPPSGYEDMQAWLTKLAEAEKRLEQESDADEQAEPGVQNVPDGDPLEPDADEAGWPVEPEFHPATPLTVRLKLERTPHEPGVPDQAPQKAPGQLAAMGPAVAGAAVQCAPVPPSMVNLVKTPEAERPFVQAALPEQVKPAKPVAIEVLPGIDPARKPEQPAHVQAGPVLPAEPGQAMEDHPALRALLRKMAEEGSLPDVPDEPATGESQKDTKSSGWRRLFRKPVC